MAKGIALPTTAVKGRLKLIEGDEYADQLVAVMLGDGTSDNPFQDICLGDWMIFEINADAVEGEIRPRVEAGFAALKRDGIVRLKHGSRSIRFAQDGADKIMYLDVTNLESGESRTIEVPLPQGE